MNREPGYPSKDSTSEERRKALAYYNIELEAAENPIAWGRDQFEIDRLKARYDAWKALKPST